MKTSRDFMRVYLIPIILLIGVLLTLGFTGYYTTTVQTQTGDTVASNWPRDFTLDFARYISLSGKTPELTAEGEKLLAEKGLWLQILDSSGAEVFQYRKPSGTPELYQPYALLELYQYGDGEYSVFLSSLTSGDGEYTYLIGFPVSISKVVMYVDDARFRSGKLLISAIVFLTAALVLTLTVYSYRTFRSSQLRQKQDELAKDEWLANITHDLKTPLAPIRGYGELLREEKSLPEESVRRYAAIIMKNTLYAEQLVDDLKLTYQLQSNMLPLNAGTHDLTRFVREVIIDILNSPEYEGRSIGFDAPEEELYASFDPQLLRRALTNIIINALKHNKPGAEISVDIAGGAEVKLTVADKGSGMSPQELEGLFKRYYRGTSTETGAEGSGLGMAIAKQIIEAHGGRISAQSQPGSGTTVTAELPK